MKRRTRDIDQIQDDIAKEAPPAFDADDDLPGQGQFYCVHCARHFQDQATLDIHETTKVHKRRLKDVAQPKYTQYDAEAAAGKTAERLPPAHAH